MKWISDRRELPRVELRAAFVAAFGRDEITVDQIKALCSRKGWATGRSGCFPKGNVPANKGRKGWHPPGCEKGWFKKGSRPHTTKQVGHEYVSANDGYVYLCVPETNPHTGFEHRFVAKHRHLWEAVHGPIPDGYCLRSIDGNKTNADPANWRLIARAVNLHLNGRHGLAYAEAEPELRPTVLAVAELRHATRRARLGDQVK